MTDSLYDVRARGRSHHLVRGGIYYMIGVVVDRWDGAQLSGKGWYRSWFTI